MVIAGTLGLILIGMMAGFVITEAEYEKMLRGHTLVPDDEYDSLQSDRELLYSHLGGRY